MFISSTLKDPSPSVTFSGEALESCHIHVARPPVHVSNTYVSNDMKWAQHIQAILAKGASRLYFLKRLKRAGTGTVDLCASTDQ